LTAEQQRLRRWLQRTRPNLIFAIGQTAYDFAVGAQLTLPMVDAFVFHRHEKPDDARTRAIAAAPPAQVVLLALQRARAGLSKVAVLHSADTAGQFFAARTAAEAGSASSPPELVSFEAKDPSHALRLLHQISRQPDLNAIWLLPDLRVLAPQVFQYAMNLQYRRRIPLMAATAIQVRQGALFALDYAPGAVAAQAARIAEDVLFAKTRRRSRNRSRTVAATLPLSPRLSINASTAARLDVSLEAFADLSPEVVR
jgi:hypothetical protein